VSSECNELPPADPGSEARCNAALAAVDRTARTLGLDAEALARALAAGLLLEIVLELKVACYLAPADQDRLRSLIRRVEGCRPERKPDEATTS